jgi:membrane-bound serine protease (ClpP class)
MTALGLLLVLMGAALVAAEAHVPSHGVLSAAAVASAAVGMGLVVSGAGAAPLIAALVALAVAAVGAVWVVALVRKLMAARHLRVRDGLIGRMGVVKAVPAPLGQVFVDGALWRAKVWGYEDEKPLEAGDACVVEGIDGLTLTVRPAEEWELI